MMFEGMRLNLIQDSVTFSKTKYLASKTFRRYERDHSVTQFTFKAIPVPG